MVRNNGDSEMSIIHDKAMLVTLSVSAWTARKFDRSATEETIKSADATADAGRFNKLLVEKSALAPLEKIAGSARNAHYSLTMPWSDSGARLLPAAVYLDYQAKMRAFREDYAAAVEVFVTGYEAHKEAARKQLGNLFKDSDYPTLGDVRRRFGMSVAIDPVPAGEDFRVSLGDAQAAMIRAEIEQRAASQLESAMRDLYQRVADVTGRMAERLTAYKPGEKGQRAEGTFKDSLVGNVRELAALLPALNVTGDPRLNAIAKRMESELIQHDATELREDLEARKSVADAAAAILADVSDLLA
jgi:hypothetical protein